MNVKPADKVLTRPICTWLTTHDYEILCAAAKLNGVTKAAYFRSVLVDAIDDEHERFRAANSPDKKKKSAGI